jgi:hypothetical protein
MNTHLVQHAGENAIREMELIIQLLSQGDSSDKFLAREIVKAQDTLMKLRSLV